MNSKFKVALAIIASAALGAVAVHDLHAQAKPKTYVVTEIEPLGDAAAAAAFSALCEAAITAAGGRPFRTAGGRIVAMEGAAAPKRVAISEWNNLEQAQAFYNSQAWKALAPQREKAVKIIRGYAIEAMN